VAFADFAKRCVVCGIPVDGPVLPLMCAGCRLEPLSTEASVQAVREALGMTSRMALPIGASTRRVGDMRVVAITAGSGAVRVLVFFDNSEMYIEAKGHDEESLRFTTYDADPRDLEAVAGNQRRAVALTMGWGVQVTPGGKPGSRSVTWGEVLGVLLTCKHCDFLEPSQGELARAFKVSRPTIRARLEGKRSRGVGW